MNTKSPKQDAYRRVLLDPGAAVAAVAREITKEYDRKPSGENFALRKVSGGSNAQHGRQRIECEPTIASGHANARVQAEVCGIARPVLAVGKLCTLGCIRRQWTVPPGSWTEATTSCRCTAKGCLTIMNRGKVIALDWRLLGRHGALTAQATLQHACGVDGAGRGGRVGGARPFERPQLRLCTMHPRGK